MNFEGRHVADQLFRSSASVAANYRAACRARSKREFIAKIGLVIEETDEALFWLEFCTDIGLLPDSGVEKLRQEAKELVSIFWATRQTAQYRLKATNTKEP
jgi:four helix bundle protein